MKQNDLYETPPSLIKHLGEIDLDPCASLNSRIAKTNWCIERNECGLERDWFGFVFCNPPFSQKEPWIKKFVSHGNGILLLPERGSAPWFGQLSLSCPYYFTLGQKITFLGSRSSNPYGTVLFLSGAEAFRRLYNSSLPGQLNWILKVNPRIRK